MSTSDKLTYLNGTKDKLKTAINYTGANITNDTFRSYSRKLYDAYLDIINNGISNLISNIPKVQGTGTYLDLTNTAEAPLIDFKMYGDTQQDSTTGKNLLSNNNTTQTINGITFTKNNNGSIKLSGTSNAVADYYLVGSASEYVNLGLSTGTYNLNGVSNGSLSTYMLYVVVNRNGTLSYYQSIDNTGLNISVQSGDTFRIFIRVLNSQTPNTTIYPQLNTGSTPISYEPYTNGPAPNPTFPMDIHNISGDNTIKICGKNLFDKSNIIEGKYIDGSGNFANDSSNFIGALTKIDNTKQYYVKSSSVQPKRIAYYDSSQAFISRELISAVGGSLTIPNNAIYLRLSCYNVDLDSLQLEQNNEATEYEAYTGNSQLISLGVENLFGNAMYNGQIGSNGSFSSSTNRISNANQEISNTFYLPVGTYTLSIEGLDYCTALTKNSSNTILQNFANSWNALPFTFTLIQAGYLYFTGRRNDNANITPSDYTPQLEKGTKANSYSEYGKPYIELNKISTYQDYIYRQDNRWFLHKEIGKYTFTGNESFSSVSEGYYMLFSGALSTSPRTIICNNYTNYLTYSPFVASDYGISLLYSETQLYVRDKDISNISALKTKLANSGTYFYYKLNTPTDTEITTDNYPVLLEQLNNLEQIKSKKNQTNINQESNDLPFIITASAIKEYAEAVE